jgi:uncharacterized protein with HEPN domain
MSSSDPDRAIAAVLYNVALARRFVEGMTLEQFAADERTIYAVTRCLEIVSEASRRLPVEAKSRHPGVPWQEIAAAGNVYRHEYEDVLASILWNTIHKRLDPLEAAVTAMRSAR